VAASFSGCIENQGETQKRLKITKSCRSSWKRRWTWPAQARSDRLLLLFPAKLRAFLQRSKHYETARIDSRENQVLPQDPKRLPYYEVTALLRYAEVGAMFWKPDLRCFVTSVTFYQYHSKENTLYYFHFWKSFRLTSCLLAHAFERCAIYFNFCHYTCIAIYSNFITLCICR